jgi:hypothetical protein
VYGASSYSDAAVNKGMSFVGTNVLFNNGGERMRLDNAGNLGLGVTPSAWSGLSGKVLEVGTAFGDKAALFQNDIDDLRLMSNVYFDGSFRYVRTGTATIFHSINGSYRWSTAPSGTAGNAISFTQAMTLTGGGNLLVGTTTDNGNRLQVNGNCITNRYIIAPNGTNPIYNLVNSDATYAGSYVMQAGGGSSGFGGSLTLYGHSHATKAGWVEAGISAISGGKFIVNSTAIGSGGFALFSVAQSGQINIAQIGTYATNALALAAGLIVGDIYKTATGQLQIVI